MTVDLDVLQVITTTSRRGAEVFATGLHRYLTDLGRQVETVALASGVEPTLDVEPLGPSRLGTVTLRRLRQQASRARVVVAHGSTTLPAAALATAGLPVRFVYRNIGDPGYWNRSNLVRVRSALLHRRAALVVALTDETRDRLIGLYRLPPPRVVTIPTGIDPVEFPRRSAAERADARRAFGLPGDARLAVCIGALSPEKAVDQAVLALGQLPGRWHLAVAGEGADRPAVEQAVRTVGPERVHLLGQLSQPARLMAAADVLVLSSLTEGVPGVVIEAASVGVPSVVTDVGFVRDVVEDGVTGAIVAPGSPAELAAALLRCEPCLDAMGLAAAERSTAWALPVIARRWNDVLSSVARAPSW